MMKDEKLIIKNEKLKYPNSGLNSQVSFFIFHFSYEIITRRGLCVKVFCVGER
jgi:hypothetical protein